MRMKLQRLVAMGPHIQEWEVVGLHKHMEEVTLVVVENCSVQPVVAVNGDGPEVGKHTPVVVVVVVVMEMAAASDGRGVAAAAVRTQYMVVVMAVAVVEVVQCMEVVVGAVLYKEVWMGEVGNGQAVEVEVMNKDKLVGVVNWAEAVGVSSKRKERVAVENSMGLVVEVNLVVVAVGNGHNMAVILMEEAEREVASKLVGAVSKLGVAVEVVSKLGVAVVVMSKLGEAAAAVSKLGEAVRVAVVVVSTLGAAVRVVVVTKLGEGVMAAVVVRTPEEVAVAVRTPVEEEVKVMVAEVAAIVV